MPVCWLARWTGIPCPGCGLSRSLSCAIHGMFGASWEYHPFGVFFLVVFAMIATASLLPIGMRRRLVGFVERHDRLLRGAYFVSITLFLTYGAARAFVVVG
ncbi:MAG: DUF2752 domain-containing protein [Planctomycetes bacterium]|nr:DUF2752 domain-containing protein [Planctomycetota bacterium]